MFLTASLTLRRRLIVQQKTHGAGSRRLRARIVLKKMRRIDLSGVVQPHHSTGSFSSGYTDAIVDQQDVHGAVAMGDHAKSHVILLFSRARRIRCFLMIEYYI